MLHTARRAHASVLPQVLAHPSIPLKKGGVFVLVFVSVFGFFFTFFLFF